MVNKLKLASLAVVALAAAGIARAYQVSPMIYDMKPTGKDASTVIRVNNTNATPITIELQSEKRLFDEAGKESRERIKISPDVTASSESALLSSNAIRRPCNRLLSDRREFSVHSCSGIS